MKSLRLLLPLFCLAAASLCRAAESDIDTVTRLDDARIAANRANDAAKLAEIYSDDLRYAHSSGAINDKATLIKSVTHTTYNLLEYKDRDFKEIAPGVVLMTGHLHIQEVADGKPKELLLSFLGVYRKEGDAWKFLAWQSNNVAPAAH